MIEGDAQLDQLQEAGHTSRIPADIRVKSTPSRIRWVRPRSLTKKGTPCVPGSRDLGYTVDSAGAY